VSRLQSFDRFTGLAWLGTLLFLLPLVGCGGGHGGTPDDRVIEFGAPASTGPQGLGQARAYVVLRDRTPVSLGVELNEAALTDLVTPTLPQLAAEVSIPAPVGLTSTPFTSVSLFVALPHPPAGNQDVPHIHPTWYVISPPERGQIPPVPEAGSDFVEPDELPPNNSVFPGGYIPSVGHLVIDPTLQGYGERPLETAEYEYRYYSGKMTLIALGVANSFLASRQSLSNSLPVPKKYRKPGYYPTRYHVAYDPARRVWDMAMDDLVLRTP
jgi:hypothetical protein